MFTSFGRETARKYSEDEIRSILTSLDGGEYGTILRAKGMVDSGEGRFIYFDYVPGEQNVREGSPDVIGRICVIGSDICEDKIAELFGL